MQKEYHKTLIIGTGCAGYACAYYLDRFGGEDILIACENKNYGTSRNTGSDKQTYYKLSLCGNDDDSVYKMARQLHGFGGVNGENALCEAAQSAECFFNLVMLGVPFPKNEYGEYVGYKTDHDLCKRATSAGPLTSKYMTEALEKAVMKSRVEVREGLVPVKVIKSGEKAIGCLFASGKNELLVIYCSNLVFATGGEASLFKESVYPTTQSGAMGVLIDAGVKLSNFCHWQFGIASVDFRWNLSGSYQQVIPKYISVDRNGKKSEFLRNSLSDEKIFELTFLKGYEWPFDARKKDGSSLIDILVKKETEKGCDVFLDYRSEPTGFGFSKLSKAAYDYLENSEALTDTPVGRLKKMNPKAYKLYKDNGIDLEREMLKIAVCAQHQNGGARVDANHETNIENLFVIGEASGIYSAYRPGGSALNSTQVGALRCAQKIAFSATEMPDMTEEIPVFGFDGFDVSSDNALFEKRQEKNSALCAIIRDPEKIKAELTLLEKDIENCRDLKTLEMLKASRALYESCAFAGENIGSYGSAVYEKNGTVIDTIDENKNKITVYSNGKCFLEEPSPIPESEQWFEKVWARFNER